MKQRQIHTKIWSDDWFSGLSNGARFLFLYLLTNDKIGLINCYEISDRQIIFDTKIKDLEKIKKELHPKVIFTNNWVIFKNYDKYNRFDGPKLEVAINKEIKLLPENIKEVVNKIKDNTLSIPYQYPINTSNNIIYNNINNKETNKEKTYTKENLTLDQVAERINKAFKVFLNRNFKGIDSFKKNLSYWLETYEPREISEAISKARYDKFWQDKLTPTVLFRRKNPQGEQVDYISQLLNSNKEDL